MCLVHEIIYEIDKNYDITNLLRSVAQVDPLQTIYRVEKIRLTQLCPYNYFVKEIENVGKIKVQFKSIQKRHIIQCIKHYEHDTNILEIDKKITIDGEYMTIDDKSVFESHIVGPLNCDNLITNLITNLIHQSPWDQIN